MSEEQGQRAEREEYEGREDAEGEWEGGERAGEEAGHGRRREVDRGMVVKLLFALLSLSGIVDRSSQSQGRTDDFVKSLVPLHHEMSSLTLPPAAKIGLATLAALSLGTVAWAAAFDYRRRNDAAFRQKLSACLSPSALGV